MNGDHARDHLVLGGLRWHPSEPLEFAARNTAVSTTALAIFSTILGTKLVLDLFKKDESENED